MPGKEYSEKFLGGWGTTTIGYQMYSQYFGFHWCISSGKHMSQEEQTLDTESKAIENFVKYSFVRSTVANGELKVAEHSIAGGQR